MSEPSKNVMGPPSDSRQAGPVKPPSSTTEALPPAGGKQPVSASAAGGGRPAPPVTGVMPPQLGEAIIREVRPSLVEGSAGIATLAEKLIRSIVLAPLGFLLLAPLFARKLLPFFPKRYTLTNQRITIKRGLKPREVQSVSLADIDEVRFDHGSYNPFYRAGTLEIISHGEVRLRLPGVPAPEAFRLAIINACGAWVPGKAKTFQPFVPASAK